MYRLMCIFFFNGPDGITSMQDMMQTYPVEIQVAVQLTADAYLDFIDALKNVLLKPDQVNFIV